jgi:hypothetical protein
VLDDAGHGGGSMTDEIVAAVNQHDPVREVP